MSNYFGTLFGRSGDYGWSEVYPIVASAPNFAASVLSGVVGLRLALMTPDATITASRLSDTDIKGDSWPTGVTAPSPGTYVASGVTTYNPQITMKLKCFAGGLKRSTKWLRAIPENQVSGVGAYLPTGTWPAALLAYSTYLIANTFIATKIHGAVTPPHYTFTALSSMNIPGVLEKRNIGRPFGLPRGRRLIA